MDNLTCDCSSYSEFVDTKLGHVVTGDLKIIKHKKLRNILSMGSKFRGLIKCIEKKLRSALKLDKDELGGR